jgi:hypothetical protein
MVGSANNALPSTCLRGILALTTHRRSVAPWRIGPAAVYPSSAAMPGTAAIQIGLNPPRLRKKLPSRAGANFCRREEYINNIILLTLTVRRCCLVDTQLPNRPHAEVRTAAAPCSGPSFQVALDFAHRHAAGIQAQNLVIETIKVGLALGDQLQLEAAGPVARDRNLDLAALGQDRLRARRVAAVASAAASGVAFPRGIPCTGVASPTHTC